MILYIFLLIEILKGINLDGILKMVKFLLCVLLFNVFNVLNWILKMVLVFILFLSK